MSTKDILNRLPRVNLAKFRKGLALNFFDLDELAQEYLWPFLDGIGQARFKWLIGHEQSLHQHLPAELTDKLQELSGYKWALESITNEDLVQFLPPWLKEWYAKDEKAKQWIGAELQWVRSQIGGKSNG